MTGFAAPEEGKGKNEDAAQVTPANDQPQPEAPEQQPAAPAVAEEPAAAESGPTTVQPVEEASAETQSAAQPVEIPPAAAEQDNELPGAAAARPLAGDVAVAAEETAPQKPGFAKRFLSAIFNKASLTTMGVGAVVGVTVKIAALAAFGSQAAALAIGAAAIGTSSTVVKRAFDINAYNKQNADNKAGYIRDFFNASKTGHNGKDYRKHLMVSSGFALVGGVIGFGIADWLNGTPADAGNPVVAAPGDDLGKIVDAPPVDDGTVVVDPAPVIEQPVVEQPVVEQPVVEQPVVEQPVVEQPAVEQPVVEQPVVEQPAVEQPVVLPLDERVAATLDEARALLPERPGSRLAGALARLDSTNPAVQAQALKDLGYFFANGFGGVAENDVMANKLYELSIEVSGGKNTQALHDLGYHLLYGKGTAVDTERAYELLTAAHAGGNRLSAPMLAYMNQHALVPKP